MKHLDLFIIIWTICGIFLFSATIYTTVKHKPQQHSPASIAISVFSLIALLILVALPTPISLAYIFIPAVILSAYILIYVGTILGVIAIRLNQHTDDGPKIPLFVIGKRDIIGQHPPQSSEISTTTSAPATSVD